MTIDRQRVGADVTEAGFGEAAHPERFDPEVDAATLMGSEHHARYRWAAPLVAGLTVLDAGCGTGYGSTMLAELGAEQVVGVDLDAEAIARSRSRASTEGARFEQGDLTSLHFPDDSFDAAVCLETIEHLSSPEDGLDELRRVVRPGGMLIVSSPNPAVYPPGNEHHLREVAPERLLTLIDERFRAVSLHIQHSWLGSMIEPATEGEAAAGDEERVPVRRSSRLGVDDATFSIVIGTDDDLPDPPPVLSIGDPFEVRWWQGQVAAARDEGAAAAAAAANEELEEARRQVAGLEAQLAEQERESARALAQVSDRELQALARLKETGSALVTANQELAEGPLLKHRLAEMHGENARLEATVDQLLNSRSWTITSFLRRLHALATPHR